MNGQGQSYLFLSSFTPLIFLSLEEGSSPWWNYPGLELWKFLNLFIFIIVAYFLLRRRVRTGFRDRMERIKAELDRAREERDQALAKLGSIETRFATLDDELSNIRNKAKAEAEAERERIQSTTEQEIVKLREQANRELERASKVARHELRRFAAQESVRIAEQILEKEIGSADDERLMNMNLEELRRSQA